MTVTTEKSQERQDTKAFFIIVTTQLLELREQVSYFSDSLVNVQNQNLRSFGRRSSALVLHAINYNEGFFPLPL
ncbi:hypothetical protein [Nostoc sp.]|uniref:hypothetical protein n=1 Tax=Nostoc sp. TaxID=1180 RepID=UPI002FF6DE87